MRRSLSLVVVLCLVAVPASGAARWTERWRITLTDTVGVDLVAAADGTVYLAADQAEGSTTILRRYSADGTRQGTARLAGSVSALALSQDGSHLAVGGAEGWHPLLAWYATDELQPVWTLDPSRDPGLSADWGAYRVTAVAIAPDGRSIYAAGTRTSDPWLFSSTRTFVLRATLQGRLLWLRWYGTARFNDARAIAPIPGGQGVLVGGGTGDGGSDWSRQSFLLAFDESGNRLWTRTTGSRRARESITTLAVSPDGERVFVAGYRRADDGSADGQDWYFRPFRISNGRAGKARVHDLTTGGPESPARMVIRDRNTLYVAGAGCSWTTSRCTAHLLTLDRRGGLRERADYPRAGTEQTAVSGLALAPDGDLYWAGPDAAAGHAWIRRVSPPDRKGSDH